MPEPAERFIEAATLPLGDNAELQVMAGQELRASLVFGPLRDSCDSLEMAVAHLEKGHVARPWRGVFYVLTAILAVATLVPTVRDYLRIRLGTSSLVYRGSAAGFLLPGPPLGGNPASKVPGLFGNLSPERKLLLFGDPSESNWADRYRALWASDPGNPVLFADYGRACSESPTGLPADFIVTADLLDPDNGWFRHLAAGVEARDATVANHVPYQVAKQGGRFPKYRITSPAHVAVSLRLMSESAAMTGYDPYEARIYRQRLDALPAGDDWVGRWIAVAYLEAHPPGSLMELYHRDLAKVVAAEAWVVASSGHPAVIEKLAADWERCVVRSLQTPVSPDDVHAFSSGISIASTALSSAALELGLTDLAQRHELWAKEVQLLSAARRKGGERSRFDDQGGVFTRFLDPGLKQAASPPHVSDDDLKPGRLADHAVTRRFLAAALIGVFATAALLLASVRYFRGYQARRLSAALAGVLTPADHAWILAGGVLLPFALHLLPDQATPLGMHGHAIWDALPSVLLRFMMAGALMLNLSLLIAGRRLGCRLGVLGWDRGTVPERLLLGIAVGLLVASGIVAAVGSRSTVSPLLAGCVVLSSLEVIGVVLGSAFSSRPLALRWLSVARAALPAQVLGMLLMALSSLAYHAREKHWIRNDRLSRIEPGLAGANRYQFEVAEEMRNSLLKTIPPDPLEKGKGR